MNKGVVYTATVDRRKQEGREGNKEQVLTELLRSYRLLKHFNPNLPVTLIACPEVKENYKVRNIFGNEIKDANNYWFNGFRGSKIQALQQSPYEKTLILDIDTLPISNIEKGFEFLDKYDIALCLGSELDSEIEEKQITNFQNGVMFVHRNNRTIELFKEWSKLVESNGYRTATRYVLSELLYRHNEINKYTLSKTWNYRIDTMQNLNNSYLSRFLPKVRILHTHFLRDCAKETFNLHPRKEQICKIMEETL